MSTNVMLKMPKPISKESNNNVARKSVNIKSQKIEKKSFSRTNNENDKNVSNLNLEKKLSFVMGNTKELIKVDLDVSMKSSKDDSAIKEYEADKSYREGVLEGKKKEAIEVKEFTSMERNSFIRTENNPIFIKNITLTETSFNYENVCISKENPPKFTSEEYRRMSSCLVRNDYSKHILKTLLEEEESMEDCLANHKVTERMRMRMIDWMIEVMSNYKCDENGFFIAVHLMDKYFKLNKEQMQPHELHLVGVTCLFIASKYQDIYPIRLKIVHERIAHKKLSTEEIKMKEAEITQCQGYIIGKPTQWEFINHFVEEIFYTPHNNFHIKDKTMKEYITEPWYETNITHINHKLYTPNMINLLRHVLIYLAKMNCHDYHLLYKKPSLLAASSIFVAMKICEQINKDEYVNDSFTKRLVEVSHKTENDIIKCAQKILYNAQNFDTMFTGLENLKKVHFNTIIELKNTK
jgi:hypothetical protein